jgi:3'(2'), 5'-bisphosphate nucleotidase
MAPIDVYSRERRVAELAVLRASILTKQIQSTAKEISKDDDSPVTIADFAAQAIIIGALRNAFPNDHFLGEENSGPLRSDEHLSKKVYELVLAAATSTSPDAMDVDLPQPSSVEEMLDWIDLGGNGQGGDQGRFWVMDPVDGTAAFLKGQQYAVSLALIHNGREVVGVLGCPNISANMTRVSEDDVDTEGFGIMLTAVRGQGATLRRMTRHGLCDMPAPPLRLLEPWAPNEKLQIVGCTACKVTRHDVIARLANDYHVKFPNTEIWSSHIRYAALIVGGGNAQFWIPAGPSSKMHIWDHAGSQLIFTELGGEVTDLNGKTVDFGAGRDFNRNDGLVVARRDFHQSVLSAMRKIVGETRDAKQLLVQTIEQRVENTFMV